MRVELGREPQQGRRIEDPEPELATLAGGCSLGLQDAFRQVSGVLSVLSGYAGGHVANPSREQVRSGTTGHVEAIQILFDPRRVSYAHLLSLFVQLRDAAQLDQQRAGTGTGYGSVVFYHNERQKAEAESIMAELQAAGMLPDSVITRIEPACEFWPAEDYR